jgi:glucose/arabinose dehydrogenase/mono/diheme cytochrome c family protein
MCQLLKFPAGLLVMLSLASPAQETPPLQRAPNTTLRMPTAPPSYNYAFTNGFAPASFNFPLAIVSPPEETNRLFVVEQPGTIAVLTNLATPAPPSRFLTVPGISGGIPTDERGLLGMAFHPGYATNGYFYVFYTATATTTAGTGLHDILARYTVSANDPNKADAASEVRLIVQRDEANNHNGGDLHFGPDGYLYVSLGDEGGANDSWNNSQRIDRDFFSAIARIDVDKRPGSLPPNAHPAATTNYAVPPDNPFIGATSFNGSAVNPAMVRTEFWAVGLRNPWRFSFDPDTGWLYCGDVGQGTWEEVDIITRGGNYGWAYREGAHPGPKTPPAGFTSINPIFEYRHGTGTNQGDSITGGVVYRGSRLPELRGAYVFADYVSGNIWSFRYDGASVSDYRRLTATTRIAGFGTDPRNGDVLLASQNGGIIHRLVRAPSGSPFPATLGDTGAFADAATLTPAAGVVEYDVNVPFWSDNADKRRWFSVPNTNLTIGFQPEANWSFPTGTVWVKHFELELTTGVPESRKRLETRLLVKNTGGVYGVTYRWRDSATNAHLVPQEGLDESFVVSDPGGILRTQVWHYPSQQECQVCHTPAGGFALGFNTAQLNRDFTYAPSGVTTNQMAALSRAGYFSAPVSGIHTLRALAPGDDATVSLEYRVRSYLAANCVQCHQPGGAPQSLWDARITTPTPQAGIVNGALVDNGGNANASVVTPGSLVDSMLLTRISTLGLGRMPPLASTVLDGDAIRLISAWITNDLPSFQIFGDWQTEHFGSTNAPAAQAVADPDGDGANNRLEFLTRTDPLTASSNWRIELQPDAAGVRIEFPQVANRGFDVQVTTNLVQPSWNSLDTIGNRPLFSVTNRNATVHDFMTDPASFYRVRVYEP